MTAQWMKDFDAADVPAAGTVWHAKDAGFSRVYAAGPHPPGAGWVQLRPLQTVAGASAGEVPAWHYVVETDVEAGHETDFNAWYEHEHLPGLAQVPGTVKATRWRRTAGSPLHLACYDLTDPGTLQRPEWLAVRHTDWSARVRPLFRNTRRTMFSRS